MKQCSKCGAVKSENDFYPSKFTKDKLMTYCKECHKQMVNKNVRYSSEYTKAVRERNKEYIDKLKRPCAKCGEYRPYLIQFHHIDPSEKKFNLAMFGARSMRSIKNESQKCVCLCANCHVEFHWKYGKQPSNPKDSLSEYLGTAV